jgi:hypothetical protein
MQEAEIEAALLRKMEEEKRLEAEREEERKRLMYQGKYVNFNFFIKRFFKPK